MRDGKINKGRNISLFDFALLSWIGKSVYFCSRLWFSLLHWLHDWRTTVRFCISYCKVQNFILAYIVGDVYFCLVKQHNSWSVTLLWLYNTLLMILRICVRFWERYSRVHFLCGHFSYLDTYMFEWYIATKNGHQKQHVLQWDSNMCSNDKYHSRFNC